MTEDWQSSLSREELIAELERLRWVDGVLAELGAHYLDLYDAAPVPYCVLDESGAIREVNGAAAALLGKDVDQLRGPSAVPALKSSDASR